MSLNDVIEDSREGGGGVARVCSEEMLSDEIFVCSCADSEFSLAMGGPNRDLETRSNKPSIN